jgi:hypothetical protein
MNDDVNVGMKLLNARAKLIQILLPTCSKYQVLATRSEGERGFISNAGTGSCNYGVFH